MHKLTITTFNRRKRKRSLSLISMFPAILNHGIAEQCYANGHDGEQLQYLSHFRFLSTWMPSRSNTTATKSTKQSVNQLASLFSKITYKGAKTSTKVPASLSASPTISAVYLCPSANRLLLGGSERTSILLPYAALVNSLYSRVVVQFEFPQASNRNGAVGNCGHGKQN